MRIGDTVQYYGEPATVVKVEEEPGFETWVTLRAADGHEYMAAEGELED